jgi:hypothetical protein
VRRVELQHQFHEWLIDRFARSNAQHRKGGASAIDFKLQQLSPPSATGRWSWHAHGRNRLSGPSGDRDLQMQRLTER